jgi:hypothetical protein
MRTSLLVATLISALLLPTASDAANVHLQIYETFNDGGTASGSLSLDPDFPWTVSDAHITTTAGADFGGTTYTVARGTGAGSFGPFGSFYIIVLDNAAGTAEWVAFLEKPLSPTGVTPISDFNHNSGEDILGPDDTELGQYRYVTYGVAFVPEPATWPMLLIGFFGIGAIERHLRRGAS